eukprot:1178698-Prorocentrum_minimum.AAC.3
MTSDQCWIGLYWTVTETETVTVTYLSLLRLPKSRGTNQLKWTFLNIFSLLGLLPPVRDAARSLFAGEKANRERPKPPGKAWRRNESLDAEEPKRFALLAIEFSAKNQEPLAPCDQMLACTIRQSNLHAYFKSPELQRINNAFCTKVYVGFERVRFPGGCGETRMKSETAYCV